MKKILLGLMLLFVVGCGPKLPPDTSVEAKLSIRGAQAAEALRGSIPLIKAAVCTKEHVILAVRTCIKPIEADKIFEYLDKAGGAFVELGGVLKIVDESRDAIERRAGTERAAAIIKSITQYVSQAQIVAEFPETRAFVLDVLQVVTSSLVLLGLVT